MDILVNNNPVTLSEPTIFALFAHLQMAQSGVAVAVNGKVVRRADYPTFVFKKGDKVVIITATHGG